MGRCEFFHENSKLKIKGLKSALEALEGTHFNCKEIRPLDLCFPFFLQFKLNSDKKLIQKSTSILGRGGTFATGNASLDSEKSF